MQTCGVFGEANRLVGHRVSSRCADAALLPIGSPQVVPAPGSLRRRRHALHAGPGPESDSRDDGAVWHGQKELRIPDLSTQLWPVFTRSGIALQAAATGDLKSCL